MQVFLSKLKIILRDLGLNFQKFLERRRYFTKDELIDIMKSGNKQNLKNFKAGKQVIEMEYDRIERGD